jgi:hypothetical protein
VLVTGVLVIGVNCKFMKIIILSVLLSISLTVNKNLSFYGFLKTNQFDKELTVGMDVEEFPSKIVFFSVYDGIESYAKTHFKRDVNESVEIISNGKKYQVCFLLSETEKRKLKSCKKHLYLTFQKTRQFGRLTIFLTGISKYSY